MTQLGRSLIATLLCWCFWINLASAGVLSDRLAAFPQWDAKPVLQPAEGDLAYPAWIAGTWTMTSILVDLVAPLAPAVITPGFDSNRQYLNQPIPCTVRFVPSRSLPSQRAVLPLVPPTGLTTKNIVSDRAFNGFNLARAYLGDAVIEVQVDPATPNRQVTQLQGGRQLLSVVSERAIETPDRDHFITTEFFQQVFRGGANPYLNQVETTTAYHRLSATDALEGGKNTAAIVADQVTAIYLSPQDPQYFKAENRPVALYRYRLEFRPGESAERK